jgi:hypothetical protein
MEVFIIRSYLFIFIFPNISEIPGIRKAQKSGGIVPVHGISTLYEHIYFNLKSVRATTQIPNI